MPWAWRRSSLWPTIPPDPLRSTVLDAVAAYVRECGLLPLRVAKIAVTGAVITPFRAAFIGVESGPELRKFRQRLRDIVGAPPLIPPHISLLYTLNRASQAPGPDFDAERLKAIAARCAEASFGRHRDRVTGVDLVFAGQVPRGVFGGVYDPAVSSRIPADA